MNSFSVLKIAVIFFELHSTLVLKGLKTNFYGASLLRTYTRVKEILQDKNRFCEELRWKSFPSIMSFEAVGLRNITLSSILKKTVYFNPDFSF